MDDILASYYVNPDVIERLHAKSILYDRIARREPVEVSGRAYTYCIYTNPKAHLEP